MRYHRPPWAPPTVRRIRDELAATYTESDIFVQMLDAWLAAPERGAR